MKYYIKDNQAGFVFKNGIFKKTIPAGTYHFSKLAGYQVEIEEMSGEMGLVYYDHVLQHQLSRGEYCFWNYQYNITQNVLDLKQKELNIVGQEILTKDKISIRMNVACMYRIREAVEFAATVSNLQAELYSAAQLAIREIVGNYKLDEILEIREQIPQEIYEALQKKEHMFCVSFLTAGIKDIILPGEI